MCRLGIFACLLMLVAVAVCVEMPPNMKPTELPKEGGQRLDAAHHDHQIPLPRAEVPHPNTPRPEGRPELAKSDHPKSDTKEPQEAKS